MFFPKGILKKFRREKKAAVSLVVTCALIAMMLAVPQPALAESSIDFLFDGTVSLSPGETFEVTASGNTYTVDCDTPLGALQAAAVAGGFSYVVSDKKFAEHGVLLLDDIGDYPYVKGGSQWSAFVNGVFKDGYEGAEYALNLIKLSDGDEVEFYYVVGVDKTDYEAVKAAATAAVKVEVGEPLSPDVDVLFDGTVSLSPGETFTVSGYDVDCDTPLGALQAAAVAGGFSYVVSDKKFAEYGVLLLDDIGDYPYVKGGSQWSAFVNGVFKDGYEGAEYALNLIKLGTGDEVEFYYVVGVDKTDYDAVKTAATAVVKTVVDTGGAMPTDWTLRLAGAKDESVSKDYFEQGLLCRPSHSVTWEDDNGDVWGGVPLWLLVGMVDDNPDVGSAHFNFNDELAALGYSIKVIAGDGWDTTLESAAIAQDDGYIVANTLNGEPLPYKTEAGKGCWPLHLKGAKIQSGQQVGNIVRIELIGLPEPPAGWTLEMLGDIGDTITQEEFEDGLLCTGSGHYAAWTDKDGLVWSGVPLWVLLGAVDDIEAAGHWTFNDSVAAEGYTVKVTAGDDFSGTFDSADVARSNDYIVANKVDGEPLEGGSAPLRLVGSGVAKEDGSLGGNAVGNIARIEIFELQTPPAAEGSWNLTLKGRISDVYSQAEFEAAAACHEKQWTDGEGNLWSGIPLWYLTGWVDDRQPHAYDFTQATTGYTVLVKAEDGYGKDFDSKDLAKNDNYIIANKCNGEPLTGKSWPLRLVGADAASPEGALGGSSVGGIAEIELTDFEAPTALPELRIVKYAADRVTILAEETVNYQWLENESGFDVIGDGIKVYKFEGITNDPEDVWSDGETYPGGFKIEDAIMGTRVRDLCSLVGGMGAGTEIVFVAKDSWETKLPYSSIYPDPAVQERQGDAVLAWFANGKYVPDYKDGMRLFFAPEDLVYSQWDMHESLPEAYWHFYYGGGVKYPSCAGLSAKYVTEIKIYSVPQGDWTLDLDGRDIGGTHFEVSRTYFEQALTCTFGANHKASYTDSKGRVWEGMPLWFFVGYVDDEDEHSSNAFNQGLAQAGYDIVITASDGSVVTIDSKNIGRNNDYIVASILNEAPIPEEDSSWPLRLVGPAATGKDSISGIVSIELLGTPGPSTDVVAPQTDDAYTIGKTAEGISTMTVNSGITGLKYFTVNITPAVPHDGLETTVFTHFRDDVQLALSAIRADFDLIGVDLAQAGFNIRPGDVIKAYLVDELNNSLDHNPTILQ